MLILQECDLNKHNIPDSKHSLLDLAKGETHKFGKANVEGVLTNTNNGISNAIKQVHLNLRRQILSNLGHIITDDSSGYFKGISRVYQGYI